jgi:hypothetical protein
MRRILTVVVFVFSAALTLGSAHAVPIIYSAQLSGPAESPSNNSPGTGFTTVIFDLAAHSLAVNVTFSGLLAGTTRSHIHCCSALPGVGTAIVATETPSFSNLPMGVTSGAFSQSFDTSLASAWNPDFIAASGGTVANAEAVFSAGLAEGEAYLNIHTTLFSGGEIRGFLQAPEPTTLFVLLSGLLGLGWARKLVRQE